MSSVTKCKECGGHMKPSKALLNQLVTFVDFNGDASDRGTQSRSGSPIMVDCLKCVDCGHTYIPNAFLNEMIEMQNIMSDLKDGCKEYNEGFVDGIKYAIKNYINQKK